MRVWRLVTTAALVWVAPVAAAPRARPEVPLPRVPTTTPGADPVASLTAKLNARRPITVAVLGDSITGGMNVPDPNVNGFPVLFCRMLEERFPGTVISVANKGIPGNKTADALARFDEDVAPLEPDLVVLQFGGNDKGTKDGLDFLPRYQQNLRRLVEATRRIGAACLIITPPMHEPVVDMPYPTAARRVAQELKVPVADVDTALKQREHDYRGFFPYFYHPQEHGHAIMALELYRAFCDLIGKPQSLVVTIDAYVQPEAAMGSFVSVPVKVENRSDKPRTVALRGEAILTFRLREVEIPARGSHTWLLPLALPHTLSGGRSLEWPLWVAATAGEELGFGLARIAAVPATDCPAAKRYASRAPFASLSAPHLALGRVDWRGERDLSADIFVSYDAESVNLAVEVTDDIVTTTASMPFGDGVEIYLDLRDDQNRGKPFYGKQCATLFVGAAGPESAPVLSSLLEDETPKSLLALKPTCTLIPRGYRLELKLPRAVLDAIAGRRVKAFGLDICLDDCDNEKRKAQMIWLGRLDNFVNPRRLGELRLEDTVPPGTMRVTIF